MEQQGYFRLFRERWIATVAGLVLGAGLATALAFAIPPTYTARASLLLSISSPDGTLSDRSQYSLDRISSYPELAFSDEVLDSTIDDLGLDVSPRELADHISAVNPTTTMLIEIGAEADSAQLAADIANSVAANLSDTVSDLENSARDDRYRTALDISNPASAPTSPSEPQKTVIIGLGILVGLALGLIAAIVWARLDTSVRTIAQVRRVSGLPVLGQFVAMHNDSPDADRQQRHDALLRETQLAVKQANAGEIPRLLVLVPSGIGDTARERQLLSDDRNAIAQAVAATGRTVLLLDTSVVSAAKHTEATDADDGPAAREKDGGLTAVLGGSLELRDAIYAADGDAFSVIAAGRPTAAVTERTIESNLQQTTTTILADFETFIVEATSLTQPVSLEVIAPYSDGLVVLVRYGHTREADLAHTLSRIRLAGLRPLGVVLTDVPGSRLEDVVAGWHPDDFAEAPAIARIPPAVPASTPAPAESPRPAPRTRSPRAAPAKGTRTPAQPTS